MNLRRGVLLGVAAAILYWAVGPGYRDADSHFLFAQAFVDGRLYLTQSYPTLELVPRPGGGWFSPFPPLVSIVMVPFAAVGFAVTENEVAAAFGGLSVTLVWLLLGRLEVEDRARLALTAAWAFGSEVLWVAGDGGPWQSLQICGAALLLVALTLGVSRPRAPFAAGLSLGLAAAARLPIGLALPMLLYLYRRGGWRWVLAGVAIPAVVVAAYNVARFGDPLQFGYGLITNVNGVSVLTESWYPHGIESIDYLGLGLYTMLFHGPDLLGSFPWIAPGIAGVSIFLTMPVLWFLAEARGRLAFVAGVTTVVVMVPDLIHGNPGVAEVGYRFIVDALPLAWLMLGLAFRDGLSRSATIALAVGGVLNVYFAAVEWLGFNG